MSAEQTLRTYDESADRMAAKFSSMWPRTEDIDRLFELVSKSVPSILEIGCWNGRDAKEIVKKAGKYVGIDYSEGMLRIARETVPGAEFVLADVKDYEFPPNLDGIFAFASLLHLPPEEVEKVIRKGYEALNPGGAFCISLKTGDGFETKTDEFGTRTYYYYRPEQILSFFPGTSSSYEVSASNIRWQEFFEIFFVK